jgi:C4-dicarboxylate-specific signal transduction histidine kinase
VCIILQVLINLIIHDMDAVNDGWDRLVSLTARFNGMQTNEIVVGDTGHRIPADKLQQVFDPFFATKAGGMGMGPPISRTII